MEIKKQSVISSPFLRGLARKQKSSGARVLMISLSNFFSNQTREDGYLSSLSLSPTSLFSFSPQPNTG
jgi:hypothetical protein